MIPANISLMKKGIYGSVSAIQPVFMGGQIINGNKLAKVGIEASELQMEVSVDQVELTTEQYYWKVVSLKEKLQTLTAVRAMLEQLEKDVANSVRVGAVNRNDLLQVQLRKGEVESTIAEAENGLNTVRQLLAQHLYPKVSHPQLSLRSPSPYGRTIRTCWLPHLSTACWRRMLRASNCNTLWLWERISRR